MWIARESPYRAARVRVVPALSEGDCYSTIAPPLDCTDRFIATWKRRFVHGGLPTLADALRAAKFGVTNTIVIITYRDHFIYVSGTA